MMCIILLCLLQQGNVGLLHGLWVCLLGCTSHSSCPLGLRCKLPMQMLWLKSAYFESWKTDIYSVSIHCGWLLFIGLLLGTLSCNFLQAQHQWWAKLASEASSDTHRPELALKYFIYAEGIISRKFHVQEQSFWSLLKSDMVWCYLLF